MRLNLKVKNTEFTHEGAPAARINVEQQLRRSMLSCFLWEKEFYEDGVAIADRIVDLAGKVAPEVLAALAVEARTKFHLRHVPLLLLDVLATTGAGTRLVSDTIVNTIQRADELAEFLAIYWRNGKQPLSAQVKKGLARAFQKFSAYQLAKYNRDGEIKLRDVMFLTHPKPRDEEQKLVFNKLANNALEPPDTWEVALSSGADKKTTWERLLREGKLGYLALLRNLRNMTSVGVDVELIRDAILARKGADRVLPFRYVAAARACPQLEREIDKALLAAIEELPPLHGTTVVLVDVSSSMNYNLSDKSDLRRIDAAATLAGMIGGRVRMFSFSERLVEVAPRRGMAAVDAILNSQPRGGTHLFDAVKELNDMVKYDRLVVITDEQAVGAKLGHFLQGKTASLPNPTALGYMINVASAENGVGYGRWTHIDGFSEAVLKFIIEHEAQMSLRQ